MGSNSLTRIKPRPLALGSQRLSHWTTREVPSIPLLFIHSVDGNLGCFHFEALMSNASINIHVQVLCEHNISISLGIYLGAKLLGRWGNNSFPGGIVVKNPSASA